MIIPLGIGNRRKVILLFTDSRSAIGKKKHISVKSDVKFKKKKINIYII